MAPVVTVEQVSGMNPAVIVGASSTTSAEEFKSTWAIRPAVAAVKAQRLVYVDDESLQRPTPRSVEGIARLCAAVDEMRPQLAAAEPAPAVRPAPAAAAPAPAPSPPPAQRPSQYGM